METGIEPVWLYMSVPQFGESVSLTSFTISRPGIGICIMLHKRREGHGIRKKKVIEHSI